MKINFFTRVIISLLLTSFLMIIYHGCNKKEDPASPDENQTVIDPDASLGDVTFTKDNSKQQTCYIDAGGNAIEVTDAAGIKWQLDMPGSFMYSKTLVTMTPIKDAASNSDQFRVSCGVIFEPDGFIFIEPAKLTVTLPGNIADPYTFYLMSSSGTHLNLANVQKKSEKVYEISVEHFSGAAGGSPKSIDELCRWATANRKTVVEKTKEFLKTPVNPPHEPPDISNLCKDQNGKNDELADKYIDSLFSPEKNYNANLISAEKQVQLACAAVGEPSEAMDLTCSVSGRILKKVGILLDTYSTNEKKYKVVSKAALKASREISLLTCEGSGAVESAIIQRVMDYAKYCRDYWYKKLVEEHNLEAYETALEFGRQYQLLGGDAEDGFVEKLQKTLKFELRIYLFTSVEEIEIEAEGTFTMDLPQLTTPVQKTGQINYKNSIIRTGCGPFGETDCPSYITNSGFNTDITVEFDLCSETPKVIFKSPLTYNAIENWNLCGHECNYITETLSGEQSYTHGLISAPFMVYPNLYWIQSDKTYKIEIPLENDAIIADKELSFSAGIYTSKIHITLEHKPG